MAKVLPVALEKLIEEFNKLPGIGPKSAGRLAYYLVKAPGRVSDSLANTILSLKSQITTCERCYNISEESLCRICADETRDSGIVCVVEEPLDVLAIENSGAYRGYYHVLGGVISPVNGIGPEELRITEFLDRLKRDDQVREIIIGTNPNLEGETTSMYLLKTINALGKDLIVSRMARGLPTGADLEYADNITLKRSIEGRLVLS